MAIHRYPGLRSFEEDDDKVFFGRDAEGAQLAAMIYAEKFVVLFGHSGVGKSSLLNTLYKKNAILHTFQPIRIRIQAKQEIEDGKKIDPVEIVKDEFEAFFEKKGITYNPEKILFDKKSERLWEWVKLAETLQAENNLGIQFVLVFDQFEEYFLLDSTIQDAFNPQLAELLHDMAPTRVLDWMASKKDNDRSREMFEWYKQVNTKIVFSIRSDKLYHMGNLVSFIPRILSSRMELKHFDPENAKEVITKPAALEGDFASPKIIINDNIQEKIIQAVINEAKEVDSSLLQVICFSIEESIIAKTKEGEKVLVYTLSDDDFKEINLEQILENFYMGQTAKFADPCTIRLVRLVMEDNFIENGERVALSEQQLITRLNGQKLLIADMLSYRLLREEQLGGKKTKYELIHDKLVPILQRLKDIRDKERNLQIKLEEEQRIHHLKLEEEKRNLEAALKEQARKKTIITLTGIVILICAIAAILYFVAGNSINDTLVYKGNTAYNNNNHYLAYSYFDELKTNGFVNYKEHKVAARNFKKEMLYDISGGDKMEFIDASTIAVHHSDKTIYLWNINDPDGKSQGKLNLKCVLPHAMNMAISSAGQYIAYRDTAGVVKVYDVKKEQLHTINRSKVGLFLLGNNPFINNNNLSDYKLAFLKNSSWLAFIDEKLNFRLYDAARNELRNYKFLTYSNEYQSKNADEFFFYSAGSNFIATKKPNKDAVRFWDMTKDPVRLIATVENIEKIFATAKRGQFAYLKKDRQVFSYMLGSLAPEKLIAENVKDIIPMSDGSKVILILDNGLKVYNFMTEALDVNFAKSNKLYKRYEKNDIANHADGIKWSRTRTKLVFVNESVIIDLDKVESFSMYNNDKPLLSGSDGNSYILGEFKDQTRLAYINQDGFIVVRGIGNNKINDLSWKITEKQDSGYLKDLYLLDQLCKFSESGRYFAFIQPKLQKKRLRIVDLLTGKETVYNFPVKYLGKYFMDHHINVTNDSNPAGGLFFLDQQKRDGVYYSNLFEPLSEKDKKTINFN